MGVISLHQLGESYPLHMWCFHSGEEEHSTPHDAIALPHPKSNPGVCSIGGGQDILVGLAAAETGGGDGPRITSGCDCSSRRSKRGARVFRMPRWSMRVSKGG